MSCISAEHRAILGALLMAEPDTHIEEHLIEALGPQPLENLFTQPHVAITPAVRRPDNGEVAAHCLAEELAKLTARRGHEHEIEEAIEELRSDVADERLTTRLAQSTEAMNRMGRQDDDDSAEYDTGPNGARIKKDERTAFDEMLSKIGFSKGRGPH